MDWNKHRLSIKRTSRKTYRTFKINSVSLTSRPQSMVNSFLELTLGSFQVWSSFWTSRLRSLSDSSPNSSIGRLKPRSRLPSALSWLFCVSSTPHWFSFISIEIILMNGSMPVDWFMKLTCFWPSICAQLQHWRCSNQVSSLRNWRSSITNAKVMTANSPREKLMLCLRVTSLTLLIKCPSTSSTSWHLCSSLQLSLKLWFSV